MPQYTTVAVLALVVGSAPASRPARGDEAPPTTKVDLSGRWTYNVELSDDAREKMREAMEERGGGPGGGGPGGRGGGMGEPGGGMGRPGGTMRGPWSGGGDPGEAMRPILEPAEELAIAQSWTEVTVDEKFGRLRRLHPDGKKYKTDNGTAELESRWKDGRLIVETKRERGASVVESWELTPDGTQLLVNVRLEGGPGPKLQLKRVYDLAPATRESP